MKRYHFFCGDNIIPGYINVDLYNPKADLVANVLAIEDTNVDEIYMSHGLEHLTFADADTFLKKAYKMLQLGGILKMVHPDLVGAAKLFSSVSSRKWEMLIYGYQSNPGEYHYSGYTPRSLRKKLAGVGFTDIKIRHERRFYEMTVKAIK